jgi:F-box and WD-40 domain protein CDC4
MLYDRPLSLHQRALEETPNRPLSAMALDYRGGSSSMLDYGEDTSGQDVDMQDAGPSTAPLQGGNKTFFHDD